MIEQTDQPAARPPRFRSVGVPGRLAAGGLLLAGLGQVARAVWEVRLALAGEPAAGPPDQGNGVHRPLDALEESYHVVTSVGNGLVALCAALFIGWLWRVWDNGRALSGRRPKYAGVWVYLGWVVPLANLWVPRGIVADAFRSTAPGRRLPVSVNVWWGLWVAGLISGVGLFYGESTDETIARAYTGVWPLLLSDAVVVGAAVAGAVAVRTVTAVQLRRLREAAGPEDPVSAPAGL